MAESSLFDCPAPQNITLIQRLRPLLGRTVTVYQPGMPKLTWTRGVFSNLTSSSFRVGPTQVFFLTSFFIVLNQPAQRVGSTRLTASAEGMGTFQGKLIRVGRDFVEYVWIPGKNVPTLFPLNLFTEVHCVPEDEE